ncbi:hypothetical protein ACIBCT_12760 [Streptosporangium sp. NPDC050855]|uniref:hypothetical protein n=1 Tax=Streptosporangium sp. NPDC050855 TaxID=3366194 RepID=UPI0037982C3A
MRKDLRVAWLNASARTAEKIQNRHGLYEGEVRDAVVCREGLEYVWNHDPDRGWRAMVRTRIRSMTVLVVLYPTSDPDDVYNLGSAYPI